MPQVTPKTSSDEKKIYAHPDVIELLSVDETKGPKTAAATEFTNFGPDGS